MTTAILLQVNSQVQSYIMMGLLALVFYFFMIRPQIKKQKDQKKFVEELKKGDKVVTTAGIHGKIVEIADTTILVEVDNGVKIRFDKAAISLDSSKALNAEKKA
ncbi:preprotein translocase subunit YajC [Mucilaginibacter sp. PPCGB 2223]|uniref:preprotein translocase subunit YajC n=1 Tax=Mucilaginibacter sp. PPCGB 2223 TaxID=1886027 RepID=UPI000825942E|nr:preprotein translocase subunit YajC [Mucilaginibacter sp. PPCGB 2223]OCX53101.1 preprotein translocase subunit YajC [Mucilaginibacter sp. PPCGB 2223]